MCMRNIVCIGERKENGAVKAMGGGDCNSDVAEEPISMIKIRRSR